MKRILVGLFLLMVWGAASADLVFKDGADEVRLFPTACVHGGTIARLPLDWRARFRMAQASIGGKHFFACWLDMMNGGYFILFEDGDTAVLPITKFIEQPGI